MAEDQMKTASDLLERRILLALKEAPRAEIPADFAERLARRLPSRPAIVLSPGRYGHRAAVACLALLLVLILALAPRATGTSMYWFSIESIFCAQFALLAVWLVAHGYTSASSL